MRGSRVQTIVNELHGEKIDIIKWTEDLPTLVAESMSPAENQKLIIETQNKISNSAFCPKIEECILILSCIMTSESGKP